MDNLNNPAKTKRSSLDSFHITKPRLTTNWKDRVKSNTSYENNSQFNKNINNSECFNQTSSGPQNTRRTQPYCILDKEGFSKTSSMLYNVNFKHHNPEICVCESCTCGRHLCKLHAIGPNMSKNTVYQKTYVKKDHIPNVVNISTHYPKSQGPHLQLNSIQRKDYIGAPGDQTSRPHPEDLLKSGGPCQQLTSYTSGFPGHHGTNQYVKPTDQHVRGEMPLKATTTYGSTFRPSQGRPASMDRNPDSFKHGQPWLGKTTYGSFFNNPNKDYFAKKVKITEKRELDPDFKHQYESIYKNDFLGKGPTACPAKIVLETKMKGFMSSNKGTFLENSDYKSLSPDFHAISLSKQTFV